LALASGGGSGRRKLLGKSSKILNWRAVRVELGVEAILTFDGVGCVRKSVDLD